MLNPDLSLLPAPFNPPWNYRLIVETARKEEIHWRRHGHYYRLHPHLPMPEGFEEVTFLYGKPVHEPDGRLKSQFMALLRWKPERKES